MMLVMFYLYAWLRYKANSVYDASHVLSISMAEI